MNTSEASPFVKLIALAIVGSVAKSLFGPPFTPSVNNFTKVVDSAMDVVDGVKS